MGTNSRDEAYGSEAGQADQDLYQVSGVLEEKNRRLSSEEWSVPIQEMPRFVVLAGGID
jgi:hypothetical protein